MIKDPSKSRHSPTKRELEEFIHLPGPSPEAVARVIMRGGAKRCEETSTKTKQRRSD